MHPDEVLEARAAANHDQLLALCSGPDWAAFVARPATTRIIHLCSETLVNLHFAIMYGDTEAAATIAKSVVVAAAYQGYLAGKAETQKAP